MGVQRRLLAVQACVLGATIKYLLTIFGKQTKDTYWDKDI